MPAVKDERKSWSSKGQFCAAYNCSNNRRDHRELSFFSFPKQHDRSRKWVINSRRDDLPKQTAEYLNKNCVMCSVHFEDSMFMNVNERNKLVPGAIPTLVNVPNPPPRSTLKRPAPKERAPPQPKRTKLQDLETVPLHPEIIYHAVCRLRKRVKVLGSKGKAGWGRGGLRAATVTKKKKLLDLRTRLSQFLSGGQLEFVMSQLRSSLCRSRGRRWTNANKAFALSLLHSSPKTYRILRSVFALPTVQTLKKAMKNIQVQPGLNAPIIEALRLKVSGMSKLSKVVVLAVDEMATKEGLSYDKGRDLVEGVCPETKQLVNHAIAFMVKGMFNKWKQVIGYQLSSGVMDASQMRVHLEECIDALTEIGLKVMVVVADQGTNNRKLFETELGVTVEKPFFHYHGQQIFTMYDPPHLLKNIRNNLKKHGFTIGDHSISWSHIVDFYDRDNSKPIRLAPRLTKTHIDLPPFAPLRVYLAAQVLSHSVAAGMTAMVQWKLLPDEALHTAKFCDTFDALFNSMNGKTFSSTAFMAHGLSDTSGHLKFWEEKLLWIQSIKSKGTRQLPCLLGWQMAIHCVRQMWQVLKTEEFGAKYLLTGRMNQDCVENLFSVIRGKGGQRDNPDAGQFRAALAQTMVDSIMLQGKNSNCQEDVEGFLLSMGASEKAGPTVFSAASSPSPYDAMLSQLPAEMRSLLAVCTLNVPEQEALSKEENNILAYISGYIVRKLRGKMCQNCLDTCTADSQDQEDENLEFINIKRYQGAKDGLICPSQCLQNVMSGLEVKYRSVIDEAIYIESVKASLVTTLSKLEVVQDIKCESCHLEDRVLHLFVNVRLHHTIKQGNRDLPYCDKRKNRKVLKFSHL